MENNLKNIVFFVLCFLFLLFAQFVLAAPPDSEYQLVLQDEFEGNVLNTDLWGYRGGSNYGCRNTRDNVRVANGKLLIDLKKAITNIPGEVY